MMFAGTSSGYASIQDKKNDLDNVNSEIEALKEEYKNNSAYITDLSAEIVAMDTKINELQWEIDELQGSINILKQQINEKLEALEKKEAEITKQDKDLSARLRAMYKNGNAGMLSVLLNSASISDLLTNVEMSKRIYASDKNLLYRMHEEYDTIYDAKVELSEMKDELVSQQDEIVAKRVVLDQQQAAVEAKRANLQESNSELLAQQNALQAQADALVEQIKELQDAEAAYSGGGMCWPSEASTRITSPFGYRYIFGGYSFHSGIDIGAYGGSYILAANSGTVIWTGWDPYGYGNYVMIDHGGGVVTLYAHSCQLLVSVGQYVSKGEVIALVGTTGLSTGNHLHFEIRVDGKYQDPLDQSAAYFVVPGVYSYD